MSEYKNVTFSLNDYDQEGEVVKECVHIHLGSTILEFSDTDELDLFVKQLQDISSEIKGAF